MPNYEYKCKTCEHRFEIWQAVGEAAPPCPECGSEVKKVLHVPKLHFKGSGFYVTDLASEKKAKAGSKPAESTSESASETKSNAASDAKSDAKTEAKSETKSDSGSASSDKTTPAAP